MSRAPWTNFLVLYQNIDRNISANDYAGIKMSIGSGDEMLRYYFSGVAPAEPRISRCSNENLFPGKSIPDRLHLTVSLTFNSLPRVVELACYCCIKHNTMLTKAILRRATLTFDQNFASPLPDRNKMCS